MFTPKWKSEAKHLVKGARKFIHYKRDLLDDHRIGEIESRRQDLIDAIKSKDREKVDEASKQLRATCENSLPRERPVGWFEENVEVMFVAIVIALGLRAYCLQPFRIPTGSMQPTLNGITGSELIREEWPSLPKRMLQKLTRGRSYVRIETEQDMNLQLVSRGGNVFLPGLSDQQFMHFFSRSVLRTMDGTSMRLPAPAKPIYDTGLKRVLNEAIAKGDFRNGIVQIPAGTVLCEGYIDTGDLVLVNKVAYHFRQPKRGEVFVFDTRAIRGIDERSGEQAKGSHYIKRLCGVPGDSLSIDSPYLLIDGKIAKEPGIERVATAQGLYQNNKGYVLASGEPPRRDGKRHYQYLASPADTLKLRDVAPPGMREYAALGDNTGSSLDSRYWGSVKEYNLVGPALLSLWPFTTGHWGFID